MKKVWSYIKFEWTYLMAELWCFLHGYIMKHSKCFNKTIRKFSWDKHVYWSKKFIGLYNDVELHITE